jgi:hypothetical protein
MATPMGCYDYNNNTKERATPKGCYDYRNVNQQKEQNPEGVIELNNMNIAAIQTTIFHHNVTLSEFVTFYYFHL